MGRGKDKKRVGKPKSIPKRSVSTNTPSYKSTNEISFNFYDARWMTSIKVRGFTNFLKETDEYAKNSLVIFNVIVPKVSSEWNQIIAGRYGHDNCHVVPHNKMDLVRQIYKEIYKVDLGEDVTVWQFGYTGSVRLFCIKDEIKDSLVPIFVDHHHLVHESKHYNDKDRDKFEYCAICDFKSKVSYTFERTPMG